nr:replication initiation protein [Microvirus sp.]
MPVPLPLSCKCLNPHKVFNPYTHQSLIVPCGHCQACVLNKNTRLSFQCDLEAASNKYCMFITLTYANRFIPRAQFVDAIDRPFGCDVVDKDTGEVLGPCDYLEEDRQKLLDKMYLFGDIPYLRKSDLQLFFKRFRYFAKKITDEKVRYFAAGEYGPVHFRPHYHILLYFNSQALLQACSEIILQSWKYGRVDCQRSKGQCSSYVTSYVNSSCSLPKIYTIPSLRPFSLHSQRLGQGFLRSARPSVYESTAEDFIHRSVVLDGKYKEFNLWRSCYRFFYPKCRGFSTKSTCELSYSYRLYEVASRLFPESRTALSLARDIAATIKVFGCRVNSLESAFPVSDCSALNDLLSYFFDDVCSYDVDSHVFQKWVYRIYVELLISKHFLTYVCDHPTTYEISRKIKLIKDFYSRLEYLHLLEFFDSQCKYFESDFAGDEYTLIDSNGNNYLPFFYDNVDFSFADYKTLIPYKLFSSDTISTFQKRIKHKKLNDLNKIFL